MTEKEAIKILQELSLERCETFRLDCGNCDKCKVTTAYNMAIKALEKQIPKKPIPQEAQYINCWMNYTCPLCGRNFHRLGISDCCYHCGQALDWGEEECGS